VREINASHLDDFEVAGRQVFRLAGAGEQMTEFIPQTFEKYFFSVTHSLVHSCLI